MVTRELAEQDVDQHEVSQTHHPEQPTEATSRGSVAMAHVSPFGLRTGLESASVGTLAGVAKVA
jgi:hypothetical protein